MVALLLGRQQWSVRREREQRRQGPARREPLQEPQVQRRGPVRRRQVQQQEA